MIHKYAKSSLVSKISFGFLVPNYAAEVINIFAPTHERTYTSIQSTIELLKVATTNLLDCDADANHFAFQTDAMGSRGVFKQLLDTLSRDDREDLGFLLHEILNDVGVLVNVAHDDINRVSLILKRAQFKHKEVMMYASASLHRGPK